MTRLERLIQIFGSQEKLAAAVGMSRSHVGHWVQPNHRHYREVLEAKFNDRVRKAADDWPIEDINEMEMYLEEACPHCHRPY